MLASHAMWYPVQVDLLMQRLGAHYERRRVETLAIGKVPAFDVPKMVT